MLLWQPQWQRMLPWWDFCRHPGYQNPSPATNFCVPRWQSVRTSSSDSDHHIPQQSVIPAEQGRMTHTGEHLTRGSFWTDKQLGVIQQQETPRQKALPTTAPEPTLSQTQDTALKWSLGCSLTHHLPLTPQPPFLLCPSGRKRSFSSGAEHGVPQVPGTTVRGRGGRMLFWQHAAIR